MRSLINLQRLLYCLALVLVVSYSTPYAKAGFGFGNTRVTINGFEVNDVKQNKPVVFEFSDPYISVTYNGKTYKYEVVSLAKFDEISSILFYLSEDKSKSISLTEYTDLFVVICDPLNLSAISRDTNVVNLLKQLKQRILSLRWEKVTPKLYYYGRYLGLLSEGSALFAGYFKLQKFKDKRIILRLKLWCDDYTNLLETCEKTITPTSNDYKLRVTQPFFDIAKKMPNGYHSLIISAAFYMDGKPIPPEGLLSTEIIRLNNVLVDGYNFDTVRGRWNFKTWDYDAISNQDGWDYK